MLLIRYRCVYSYGIWYTVQTCLQLWYLMYGTNVSTVMVSNMWYSHDDCMLVTWYSVCILMTTAHLSGTACVYSWQLYGYLVQCVYIYNNRRVIICYTVTSTVNSTLVICSYSYTYLHNMFKYSMLWTWSNNLAKKYSLNHLYRINSLYTILPVTTCPG